MAALSGRLHSNRGAARAQPTQGQQVMAVTRGNLCLGESLAAWWAGTEPSTTSHPTPTPSRRRRDTGDKEPSANCEVSCQLILGVTFRPLPQPHALPGGAWAPSAGGLGPGQGARAGLLFSTALASGAVWPGRAWLHEPGGACPNEDFSVWGLELYLFYFPSF